MATFIEKNLSNRVDTLRRAFQREYSEVYAAWAGDPIHTKSPAEYDTHRCWRMVEIADQHLEHIARNYPRRFLIKLLRTLPLENVKRITLILGHEDLLRHILAATAAAWRFGNTTIGAVAFTSDKHNDLRVTREELEFIRKHSGQDAARFLGAVHARQVGEVSHRFAGKGQRLVQPEKVQPEHWAKFQNYPKRGFLVLPRPSFERDDKIEWAINLYESRKKSEMSSGTSGFRVPRSDQAEDCFTWLRMTIPADDGKVLPVQVCYPGQDAGILTRSYFAVPTNPKAYLDRIKDFRSQFEVRFGFSVDSFEKLCEALYHVIVIQTGYSHLDLQTETISGGVWYFQSTLQAIRFSSGPGAQPLA